MLRCPWRLWPRHDQALPNVNIHCWICGCVACCVFLGARVKPLQVEQVSVNRPVVGHLRLAGPDHFGHLAYEGLPAETANVTHVQGVASGSVLVDDMRKNMEFGSERALFLRLSAASSSHSRMNSRPCLYTSLHSWLVRPWNIAD